MIKNKNAIPLPEVLQVYRQLSTLISAGLSLTRSLEIIMQSQINSSLRKLLQMIFLDLENGSSFHRSLERHPICFDPFSCQLIRIGEQSGTLELMLKKITVYKEKELSLHSQLKQALFYPILVFLFALATSLILLLLVVPHFAVIFQQFPQHLPWATQVIIQLSCFLQEAGLWLGLCCLLLLVFLMRGLKSLSFRRQTQHYLSRLPWLGEFQLKVSLARFARYLAIMLAAAIPLSEALLMLSPLFKQDNFRRSILRVHAHINAGKRFHGSLNPNPLFPALLVQMVRTGEESGRLDLMLEKFAEIMEMELEQRLQYCRLLLEPLIIGILGVLIGGVVIAMYLPIFRLGTVI